MRAGCKSVSALFHFVVGKFVGNASCMPRHRSSRRSRSRLALFPALHSFKLPITSEMNRSFRGLAASPSAQVYLLAALPAMLIGGSSKSYPLLDATVQVVALLAVFIALWAGWGRALLRLPVLAQLLLAGAIMLPLLHLLPLPYGVWTGLGGRAEAGSILALMGAGDAAHSLSLSLDSTWAALLALLPPFAAFVLMLAMPTSAIRPVLAIILSVIILSLAIGVIQVMSGGVAFPFYENFYAGSANGLLANRNHHADLLAIGIAMLVIWRKGPKDHSHRPDQRGKKHRAGAPLWLLMSAGAMLFAGVLATQSRAGLTVTVITLIMVGLYLVRFDRKSALTSGGAVAAVIAGAVIAYLSSARVQGIAARFANAGDDPRPKIWQATLDGASAFFPFGAGLGSFDAVYPVHEPLNFLDRPNVNAAHNDYLELLLTGGVPAAVLVVLLFVVLALAWRNYISLRRDRRSNDIVFAVSTAMVVLFAHSLFDYPLQTHMLSFLFASFLALLLRFSYFGPEFQGMVNGVECGPTPTGVEGR